jgi:hypothetical protein
MKIQPGNDYVFTMRSSHFTVRWHWIEDEGVDDSQFTLVLRDDAVGHGVPNGVRQFVDSLPITDSYETTESVLREGIQTLKGRGFSVKERPFNTGRN